MSNNLILLFSFILYCVISLMLNFCGEKISLWQKQDTEPHVYQPKLTDLNTNNIKVLQEYVEFVIEPAYHYFKTLNVLKRYQKDHDESWFITSTVLRFSAFLLVVQSIIKTNVISSNILCVLIALAVCLCSSLIISFIYKHTNLPIEKNFYSISRLNELFKEQKDTGNFKISEKDAWNNFLILYHRQYVCSIENTILFRWHIKKVLNYMAVLIYVLFFMCIPE